jgi:hypothetical protein
MKQIIRQQELERHMASTQQKNMAASLNYSHDD